jgi:hypothetical protein
VYFSPSFVWTRSSLALAQGFLESIAPYLRRMKGKGKQSRVSSFVMSVLQYSHIILSLLLQVPTHSLAPPTHNPFSRSTSSLVQLCISGLVVAMLCMSVRSCVLFFICYSLFLSWGAFIMMFLHIPLFFLGGWVLVLVQSATRVV